MEKNIVNITDFLKEEPDFDFWFPAEIEKANNNEDGVVDYSNMFMSGIASTEDVDLDEQILKSDGLDVNYLLQRGFINWHHQPKNAPATVIGEPVVAKITSQPKGLFIKAKIYDTDVGRQAYDLANMLKKQSSTRRLGWSIEGKVVEKDGNVITKARLTGVALTHAPKNRNTFADLCKAMVTGDTTEKLLSHSFNKNSKSRIEIPNIDGKSVYIIEGTDMYITQKAIEAGTHGAGLLSRESLEGGLKVQKQKPNVLNVLKQVLKKKPNISFEKALKVSYHILDNMK